MNHEKVVHVANCVLYAINAVLWTTVAHQPKIAFAWLLFSIGSGWMARRA